MKYLMNHTFTAAICAFVLLSGARSVSALTLNEVDKLRPLDGAAFAGFGHAMAVDGDIALITTNGGGPAISGRVYVFVQTSGVWTQQAELVASDSFARDSFGFSVAIDGDIAVVGASFDDDNGPRSGSAYVFDLSNATGTISEVAKLLPSDGESGDFFGGFPGAAVAVSGTVAIIGARGDDDNGDDSGSAYVFDLSNATGTISEVAKLLPSDGAEQDRFGVSVAFDGNIAVVGAPGRNNDEGPGSAYVFNLSNATGTISEVAKLLGSDVGTNRNFGWSIALDGTTVVVGRPDGLTCNERSDGPGAAYVFNVTNAAGTMNEVAVLRASDGELGDCLGAHLAIDGDIAVTGSMADGDNGPRSGSAYAFDLTNAAGTVHETAKLLASDGAAGDLLGSSAGVRGATILVGARVNDDNGTNSGSAYVFTLVADEEPPLVTDVLANPNPITVNRLVTLTATVDDTATGESNIAFADYFVDASASNSMAAQDGTFDEVTEDVTANIGSYAAAGVHTICVSGTDEAGNTGARECTFLAVYDPDAGFVTGGGWIQSPSGAYAVNPLMTGKASFGFVSRYKRGQNTPTGNTQFQFRAGDLNFHSDSYEWLVIAGHRAQYKGVGTINGGGDYGFILSAIDANLTPSTNVDLFRIKIWDKDAGDGVVYDNNRGGSDGADPATAIGGGSIIIHSQ